MAMVNVNFSFITNFRGNTTLFVEGYKFHKNKQIDKIRYWKCAIPGCKVKIVTEKENIRRISGRHDHPPVAGLEVGAANTDKDRKRKQKTFTKTQSDFSNVLPGSQFDAVSSNLEFIEQTHPNTSFTLLPGEENYLYEHDIAPKIAKLEALNVNTESSVHQTNLENSTNTCSPNIKDSVETCVVPVDVDLHELNWVIEVSTNSIPCPVVSCLDLNDADYDGVIVITDVISKLTGSLQIFQAALESYKKVDNSFDKIPIVLEVADLPAKRLIFSCTGPLNRDYDDVRRFSEAAQSGIKRAIAAGCKIPLLIRAPDKSFENADVVTLLGALHALYVPLEIKEDESKSNQSQKVDKLGFYGTDIHHVEKVIHLATALESGRTVYRDIGGSDPERMAAPRVANYVMQVFPDSSDVKVNIISDQNVINEKYPLLGAVNRATIKVPRHHARVILLEYTSKEPAEDTIYLVGKGVTYDTGGADIKAGGVMAGMSRDKCGAAAVAGFFKILSVLKPKKIRVIGGMAMVRNSVGEECYVSDEIVKSKAGVRVRVGNTDAEGRMAMTDLLCEFKEQALKAVNPHLITIATLTGHAVRAVGPNYTIVLDNGPAQKEAFASKIQKAGESMADPLEISTIRREDYEFVAPKSEYEDVLQANNLPSTNTARGHQYPAAFMIKASGLDKHGIDSSVPLKYSHLDIAGSSGSFPLAPTGAPIVAMAATFLYHQL